MILSILIYKIHSNFILINLKKKKKKKKKIKFIYLYILNYF